MNENESILKALSLIAAELHIQNEISIAIDEGYSPGYPYVTDNTVGKLASHFKSYFEGGGLSPGAIAKFCPRPKV